MPACGSNPQAAAAAAAAAAATALEAQAAAAQHSSGWSQPAASRYICGMWPLSSSCAWRVHRRRPLVRLGLSTQVRAVGVWGALVCVWLCRILMVAKV